MNEEELAASSKPAQRRNLERMSIEALNDYVGELETEIARTREAIEQKNVARGAADSVFKS